MHLRAISKYKAPGGLYLESFLRYKFEGLTFGGAYTLRGSFLEFYGINFTVDFRQLQHSREIVKRSSYRRVRANKPK